MVRGAHAPPDWEAELNPEQLEAVTRGEGPLVVFAGAGSGKTRVITYRIIHLILERSVGTSRILGLTFTNKAAGEMRTRVQAHLDEGTRPPLLCTFHALCARLLRMHGQAIGLAPDFSIYGEQDQIAVLRRVLSDLDLDAARFNPKAMRGWIDSVKREGVTDVARAAPGDAGSDLFVRIHEAYGQHLERQAALDFNDLLLKAIELLSGDADLRARLVDRTRHVLVDEFQDTNGVQMRLLELLAPPPDASLCVVGDDDQSIYRWRGANVRNILEFRSLYPDAHIVKLERNYRSTGNILSAAQAVIERNPTRAPKRLWTDRQAGEPIEVYVASSEGDEGRYVADRAKALGDAGISFARQAVLYRIHAQSRALEEALGVGGIPYRIVGGTRFFDRAEIRDLVAYLRLARNPSDDVALLRVLNTPPRGLGTRALETVRDLASRTSASLFEAACRLAREGGRRGRSLAALTDAVRTWHEASAHTPASVLLERIVEETAFMTHLEKAHGREAESRILNVRELAAGVREYEMEDPDGGLDGLLERFALHTDLDEVPADADSVTLMTVHSAKGLEFHSVTVTGLEEDLFPYQNVFTRESLTPEEQDEELQEERRLFYVAVTRARTHLALTCARRRRLFGGGARYRPPSPFLDDIPERITCARSWVQHRASPQAAPEAGPDGIEGTRVRHARFGTGVVVRAEEGVRRKLVIRFDDGRTRKIIEDFVKPA